MSTPLRSSQRRSNVCPLCGAPASPRTKPFCGPGCRDRDLLNWLGDAYRVPGPPAAETAVDGLDSDA